MGRLFFAPMLSLTLFVVWILLSGISPGQILLGVVLAVVIPPLIKRRGTRRARHRAGVAVRLFFTVLVDIVTSAIILARLILGPHDRLRPGFLRVPLQLRDPDGVVILASIITMTPGTLTVEVADDRDHLLVHAFDLADPAGEIIRIKRRYETPLMAIFGESSV